MRHCAEQAPIHGGRQLDAHLAECLNRFLNVKALVVSRPFHQGEGASVVGSFSLIVKYSRIVVAASWPEPEQAFVSD